jgi:hypothetical protein
LSQWNGTALGLNGFPVSFALESIFIFTNEAVHNLAFNFQTHK